MTTTPVRKEDMGVTIPKFAHPATPRLTPKYTNPYANGYVQPTKVVRKDTPSNVVKLNKRVYEFLVASVLVLGISLAFSFFVLFGMVNHADEFYRSNMQLKNSSSARTFEAEVTTIDGDIVTFIGEENTYITKMPLQTLNNIKTGESYSITYSDGDLVSLVKQD